MVPLKESLDFIYKQQKELSNFGGIGALLGWDQMTYMPSKGIDERADQISLISRLAHERVISDEFYHQITNLSKEISSLSETDRIVITRLKEDVEKARKIPAVFVEKMSQVTTHAYATWQEAKENNTFPTFAPHLEKIIELEKEYCDLIQLPGHPYNCLLDDYEEGMTVQKLQHEFQVLKPKLVEILETITESKRYQQQRPVALNLDTDTQQKLCKIALQQMNLPTDRTRLDVSAHPFTTTLSDDDVRITTNYEHKGLLSSFFSTVHETGHALYELGLPKGPYKDTVISDAPSLGIHESQSRFWENMIARSRPFWTYFAPVFKKTAPDACRDMNAESWYRAVNQVRPSLIRVEADELTYCLHVILRFELELMLIDGKITVAELPRCWNEKMTELLGVTPKTDTEGVLQDMHWSGGEFGYFPTYAIGTIYGSQLVKKITQDLPGLPEEIANGNLSVITSWLHEHVHKYGRLMNADDIIRTTCGEGLNSNVFVAYLKEKYYPLYEV
jgi:carboxypeptidase Taq